MRSMMVLAGCAAALAACGPSGDGQPKTEAAVKAEAKAEAGDATAFGDGPRPGLWRIATQISGLPAGAAPPVSEVCIRESRFEHPEAPMQDMQGMECRQDAFRREGDVIVGRSVCTMGEGMRSESNIRIAGDFSRRYTMEVRNTITPAPTPELAATTMTMTAERIGDCPASAQ